MPFKMTPDIYEFQENQSSEAQDNKVIKKEHITCEHSCLNLSKQAQEIFTTAQQHNNKDLLIILSSDSNKKHACYIKVNSTNEVCYMDPNHDAYRFSKKEEFFEFYAVSFQISLVKYRRYQLFELHYSPHRDFPHTYSGKWRSFLTGTKYYNRLYELSMLLLHFIIGLGLNYFTRLNALHVVILYVHARNAHLPGALAIPRYLLECKETITEFLSLANLNNKEITSTNYAQNNAPIPLRAMLNIKQINAYAKPDLTFFNQKLETIPENRRVTLSNNF